MAAVLECLHDQAVPWDLFWRVDDCSPEKCATESPHRGHCCPCRGPRRRRAPRGWAPAAPPSSEPDVNVAEDAADDRLPFAGMFDFEQENLAFNGRMMLEYRCFLGYGAYQEVETPTSWGNDMTEVELSCLLRLGWCDRRRCDRQSPMQTPLHFAARNGKLVATRWLLAHGASPDLGDAHGATAVTLAAHRRDAELLEHLLPHSRLGRLLPNANLSLTECALMRRLTAGRRVVPATELGRLLANLPTRMFRYVGEFLPITDEVFCNAVIKIVSSNPALREPATPVFVDCRFPL